MEIREFAVHVCQEGDQWAWAIIDEEGGRAAAGQCPCPRQAETEAGRYADKLSRFREVTKGGW